MSLAIGPRDGNHACDLTEIDLTVTTTDGDRACWQLAADISPDVLAGNPHADRLGQRRRVALLYRAGDPGCSSPPVIPADSVLARWRDAQRCRVAKKQLAEEVQQLLAGSATGRGDEPDAVALSPGDFAGGPGVGHDRARPRVTQIADSIGRCRASR